MKWFPAGAQEQHAPRAVAIVRRLDVQLDLRVYGWSDGFGPVDGLVLDPKGNLYGTTSEYFGGDGTVFEIMP